MGQYERRYLQVDAEFLPDGKVLPKVLYWENEDGYCKINCAKRKRHKRRHSLQTLVE